MNMIKYPESVPDRFQNLTNC